MTDLLSKTKQANVLASKKKNFLNWTEVLSKLKLPLVMMFMKVGLKILT